MTVFRDIRFLAGGPQVNAVVRQREIHDEGHEDPTKMEFDELSNRVIGCANEVHRIPGPGLLESTCEQCLAPCFRSNGPQQGSVPLNP